MSTNLQFKKLLSSALLLLLVFVGSLFSAEPTRTWTDRSGRNRIRASLVDFSQAVATLKKADGSVVEIHQNRLSVNDQKYLAGFARKRNADWLKSLKPGATVEARNEANFWLPAKIVAVKGRKYRVSFFNYKGEEEVGLDEIRRYAGVTKSAEMLKLKEVTWQEPILSKLSADASTDTPKVDILATSVFDLGSVRFPLGMLAAGDSVLVAGGGDEHTQIYWCDTKRGSVRGPGEAIGHQRLAAISPAEDVLATFAGPRSEELQFWRFAKDEVTPTPDYLCKIEPLVHSADARSISGVVFVDSKRVIIETGRITNNTIVLWDVTAKKPLAGWKGQHASISRNGKRLAFTSKDGMRIVDLESGEQLGVVSSTPGISAFSLNGSLLAIHQGMVLEIQDLREPAKKPLLIQTSVGAGAPLLWTSDRHVLVNQQVLVDIEQQVVVWKFTRSFPSITATPANLLSFLKGRFCYAERDRKTGGLGVVVCDLVDKETQRLIETKSRGAINIGEGKPIRLEIDSPDLPADEIQPAFAKLFERNRWKLAKDAAPSLKVVVRNKEIKKGAEKRYTVDISLNDPVGELVWKRSEFGTREKIESTLADLVIPATFADAKFREGFGKSQFTATGIVIQP